MFDELYLKPKTTYYATDDTSFQVGDSPIVLDVKTNLGRTAIDGYIYCDGTGDILVGLSFDGVNYKNDIRLKSGNQFPLKSLAISKIKITHSGTDSSYRVYCV